MKKFVIPLISIIVAVCLIAYGLSKDRVNKVYINNYDATANSIIVNGSVLVNQNAFQNSKEIKWRVSDKKVFIYNGYTTHTVQIKIGEHALFNNLKSIKVDVPARFFNNEIYVPLRACAEGMDAQIAFENHNVYFKNIDPYPNLIKTTKSDNLSLARMAVLTLNRRDSVNLNLSNTGLRVTEPGFGMEYLFPEGEINRFFKFDANYEALTYYEVKDNFAQAIWAGQLAQNNDGNPANAINMLQEKMFKEVGKRPLINKKIYYFYFNSMSYKYNYGYTDVNGHKKNIKETSLEGLIGKDQANDLPYSMYIPNIQEEIRTDQRGIYQ